METNKELIDQLREYAGNAGYSHQDYADTMLQAAAALSQRSEAVEAYVTGHWFDARTIDEMQEFYLSRLPAIREAAKEHGYAIGVHGSMRRDFDLMAMQWRDDASDIDSLARAIADAACGIRRDGSYDWEKKPNGRVATSIPVCWTSHDNPEFDNMISAGHIDLSIITSAAPAPSAADGEQPFPLAWSHAQRIAEAEQFLKAYSDTNMEKLLGDYLVQPIIRKLAAMIGQWQQAAAYAMSADNCAAQPTPAQGDAVPVESNSNGLEREAAELARADQSPVKITDDELAAFHRFCDCCEDFDAGGHDVPKDMMRQLTLIGLVRAAGPNRHETTNFGDWIRDASNTGTPPANATRQSSADAVDAARLDFMAQREAWIAWAKDGESCRVFISNEDGENLPLMGWVPEAWAHDARTAIDKARAAIAAHGGKG